MPGEPRTGIDLQFETIIRFYNDRDAERLIRTIGGDGPVSDPSVIPGREAPFASVAEWLAAAETVDDTLATQGYGYGEPFEMFVTRTNDALRAQGIDSVFVTLEFWANQNCELRVGSGQIISSPDPCRYGDLFSDSEAGCRGPFAPRANHFSAWTGSEVLIVGGSSGSTDAPLLTSGLAYNPATDTWRDVAPMPIGIGQWPTQRTVWTGRELIVIGRTAHTEDNPETIVTMSYVPVSDAWRVRAPVPDDRMAIGGVAWTGEDLIIAGGDLHYPTDDAWAYSPATDEWRRLPDPGFGPTEGANAVWTGTEVFVFGGYAGGGVTPSHAYNPATDTWRQTARPPGEWVEDHDMTWTGEVVLVGSGHFGPSHSDTLMIYDPAGDEWSSSSPMPILPAERQTQVWTDSELIVWGGLATYGERPDENGDFVFGEGAAYDPATDTWRMIAPSPLTDRCDHSATWTGDEIVFFGGMEICGHPGIVADGHAAAYDPGTDQWRELAR